MIRTVHVFQCGSADLYGITRDQTGANLPTDECTEGGGGSSGPWRWRKAYRRVGWLSLGRNAMPRCGPRLRIMAISSVKRSPCHLSSNRTGKVQKRGL